ncbi:DUF1330 domain-containing protein (plasmid) [Bosea sp. F3-2]|nr:DUF1330 domain-containing protein [Bosea sp. F3-2]
MHYHSVSDPDALAAYAKLSGPAILAAGSRILARGMPSNLYEEGLHQRTVVIEFVIKNQILPKAS